MEGDEIFIGMDPANSEGDQEFVLIIRRTVFGKPDHIPKAAYEISKLLHDHISVEDSDDRVKVFWAEPALECQAYQQAHEVFYDRFMDDSHHHRKPWWEQEDQSAGKD